MANTYTKIFIHIVFAVKNRQSVISNEWKTRLYQYMVGITNKFNHKIICINGVQDHVHILLSLGPAQSLSDFIRILKSNSSKWINEQNFIGHPFEWQTGYGAFSLDDSEIERLKEYIKNQEIHHQKIRFIDEFKKILDEFSITYQEEYIFKEIIPNDV